MLPPGVANDADARVTAVYPVQLTSAWLTAVVLGLTALVWWLVEKPWLPRERIARLTGWPCRVALGLTWALTALTVVYGAVTAIAWTRGWALPSTAAIVGSGLGRWLALAEPHAPELALILATVGASAGWIARTWHVDHAGAEAKLLRTLVIVGFPVLFAALVFSTSAQWAGLWRPGDLSFFSIAGLLPFSDANSLLC